MLRGRIDSWSHFFGLDFHVLTILIFRGWGVLAGAATLLILPLYLSPIEQGYYFTFGSVLAIQIFFELGLNQIIVQLVSHEVAYILPENNVDNFIRNRSIGRLNALIYSINRWYSISALMFAVITSISGIAFFFNKVGWASFSVWLGPWLGLVLLAAFNLRLSPKLAVFEGFGKVGQVARIRLIQSSLGYLLLWILLVAGMGLWSIIAVPLLSAVCTSFWLKNFKEKLDLADTADLEKNQQINWRLEILPLQWRIALSWISGYFIFNLFIPVAFSQNGPAEAGRLGIAMSIFSAVLTVGMSWVNAKTPNFTMLLAQGERVRVNELFKGVFIRSVLAVSIMSMLIVLVCWYGEKIGLPLMQRIASPRVLAILGVVTVVNAIVYGMAVYMRANREEPMFIQSLAMALLVGLAVMSTAKHGIELMMFSYMIICIFISLPWTIFLFQKYFKRNMQYSVS